VVADLTEVSYAISYKFNRLIGAFLVLCSLTYSELI